MTQSYNKLRVRNYGHKINVQQGNGWVKVYPLNEYYTVKEELEHEKN